VYAHSRIKVDSQTQKDSTLIWNTLFNTISSFSSPSMWPATATHNAILRYGSHDTVINHPLRHLEGLKLKLKLKLEHPTVARDRVEGLSISGRCEWGVRTGIRLNWRDC
jgi:hypothetical protein